MKLVEINWNPEDRQLRQFGLISLVAIPAIGWMWDASGPLLATLILVSMVLASVGLILPRLLKPVFLTLVVLTMPVGLVIGELAMLTIYFVVFLPLGLLLRMTGRDPLQRQPDRVSQSFWESRSRPASAVRYYRQS